MLHEIEKDHVERDAIGPESKEGALGEYILEVYNTCTKKKELVAVTRAVYFEYRRADWRDAKRDRSFFSHEFQFSSMSPNGKVDVDLFHEFHNPDADPAEQLLRKETYSVLCDAVKSLSPDEQVYIKALFEDNLTEAELAERLGVSQQAVDARKRRILKKLKKFMTERL